MVRGSWRPNRTAIYWPPTLMAVSVVSFSFSRTTQLEAQGPSSLLDDGFLYCILSPTDLQNSIGGPEVPFGQVWLSLPHLISNFSGPQLIRGSKGPFRLVWLSLSHLISNSVRSLIHSGAPRGPSSGRWFSLPHLVSVLSGPKLTDFLSSLSYIIVQSPTQSLEWHVWSSSSGNNYHAVQRSLSSGASVYECTMWFFTLSHFVSQARLRDFLS